MTDSRRVAPLQIRAPLPALLAGICLFVFAACAPTSGPGGRGGSGAAGNSGTAGNANQGGRGGTTGAAGVGGLQGSAGASAGNGVAGTGGTTGAGGRGGTTGAAGAAGAAGASGAAGTIGVGGAAGSAGAAGTTGAAGRGGATGSGGTTGRGGATAPGGTTGTGGATSTGGTTGTGGRGGTNGGTANGCPVKLEGWAEYAGTTGGGDVPPQRVTTTADLIALGKDDTPRVLELDGTFDFGITYFQVGSNKTFIGIGKNTVLKAAKSVVSLRRSHNVILRNFTVIGGGKAANEDGDSVTATQADRLWFDHLAVLDGPDGILDLTQGTTHATISWCKFWYTEADHPHRYALLFSSGTGSGDTDRGKMDHTLHHNWFAELVDQRMPRLLWGKGHMYNNFYNSPGNSYCIGGGTYASLLIENNYFKDVADPYRFQDDGPVFMAASGNVFENTTGTTDTGLHGTGDNPPGPWTPPYAYSLEDAKNVPDIVKRCAGPQ